MYIWLIANLLKEIKYLLNIYFLIKKLIKCITKKVLVFHKLMHADGWYKIIYLLNYERYENEDNLIKII